MEKKDEGIYIYFYVKKGKLKDRFKITNKSRNKWVAGKNSYTLLLRPNLDDKMIYPLIKQVYISHLDYE